MPILLVVSTAPGAGKTSFAASFAEKLIRDGASVTLGKAFAEADDPDPSLFRKLVPHARHLSPVTLSGGTPTAAEMRKVAEAVNGAAVSKAVAVIEGLAGEHAVNRALAEELDASVVLIAGQNDEVAAASAEYGDRLAGVVINNALRYQDHQLETEIAPALRSARLPYLGAVPEDRRLVAVTAREINEHLGGEWLEWEENADQLVENILIGGIVLDWGPLYFSSQENAAVLVRGDRPDIQIAALATPIKALILTGGIEPVEYVFYEADKVEVPVTVVQQDTHEAAKQLESLLERSRFDHPDKLERFLALATECLDLARLEAAITQPVTR